jgi:hypothetical protein
LNSEQPLVADFPIREIVNWTDQQLDDAFTSADTIPLGDQWVNANGHRVDADRHELFNDANWKGFLPKDIPLRGVMERLATGYAKRFWRERGAFLGETIYVNGAILVNHALEDLTLDRPVNDLAPGRYTLLRYTDPVFEHIFYDVMKLVSPDLILYRGYAGRFPEGRRGFSAPLMRRFAFAQMGPADHARLFAGGAVPVEDDMIGTWRLEAIATSNQPTPVARLTFDRSPDGRLRSTSDTSAYDHNLLLPTFVSDHFEGDVFTALQGELRTVDRTYMVGVWTTRITGPYAKMLVAGSPGLFHADKAKGRARQFRFLYILTRT